MLRNLLRVSLTRIPWAVSGLSEGDLDFGGTNTTNDFARGLNNGATGTGGIWAFDTGDDGASLGIQPGGSDWNPGSFTLKLQNNSGVSITSLDIAYSIYVYNDQDRSSNFNFSHSADNSSFDDVPALGFASPELGADSPGWVETFRSTTLSGLSIVDGGEYYLRWSGDDAVGRGSRDQFGLDNISISAVPEPAHFGLICGSILLLLVSRRIRSR